MILLPIVFLLILTVVIVADMYFKFRTKKNKKGTEDGR